MKMELLKINEGWIVQKDKHSLEEKPSESHEIDTFWLVPSSRKYESYKAEQLNGHTVKLRKVKASILQ